VRARIVAPLLAAVLGIAGGVTTALVTTASGPSGASAAFEDPLGLGIPLVDQPCSAKAIAVVGYGDDPAAMSPAVANAKAAEDDGGDTVRYLRYDESCPTVYGPDSDPHPTYAVYTGPYAAVADPCAVRMEGGDDRGSVTILRAGNEDFVKCSCVLPAKDAPLLTVDMVDATARDRTWTRLLQVMLLDADASIPRKGWVTGDYNQATADRVAAIQATSPGKQTDPGVVDQTTWGILNDRLCRNYRWGPS
jgi:hypothetical protein